MKILRYALYGCGALALLVAGAVSYWVATFDARDYHERIVQFVEQHTGRTLEIQGEVALTFWPAASVRLGALTLSERGGAERFASVESARLKLKLRPLLERELVADELVITGADIRIVRLEDGRLNIDDLFAGEGGAAKFEFGRITLERSTLTYQDLDFARRFEFSQIELRTGRVTSNTATPITLGLRVRDREETFNLNIVLKGQVAFDTPRRLYALDKTRIEVKGHVPGLSELAASAGGSVRFDAAAGELGATQVSLALAGTAFKQRIRAEVQAPKLVVAQAAYIEGFAAMLDLQGAAGATNMTLATQRLMREGDTVAADSVTVELALKRAQHAVHATIVTPLEGSVRDRTVLLKALAADFLASGMPIPGNKLSGSARGSVSVDWARERVQAKLAGKVADSSVKLELAVAGFAAPVYTFAADLDQLDLDRYTVASPARRQPAATVLDLSALAALPATGTLNIGVLKSAEVKARDVRLVIR